MSFLKNSYFVPNSEYFPPNMNNNFKTSDPTIMFIKTIFVPYLHRSVSKDKIISSFSRVFRQQVVSSIHLVTKTGDDGLTYKLGFIYFNYKADPTKTKLFNKELTSDQGVYMTYYCTFLKCQRRFRCYLHKPKPLNANAKPFVPMV
jgi:hypothetical protein